MHKRKENAVHATITILHDRFTLYTSLLAEFNVASINFAYINMNMNQNQYYYEQLRDL